MVSYSKAIGIETYVEERILMGDLTIFNLYYRVLLPDRIDERFF